MNNINKNIIRNNDCIEKLGHLEKLCYALQLKAKREPANFRTTEFCLSPIAMQRYLHGRLELQQMQNAEKHILVCDRCFYRYLDLARTELLHELGFLKPVSCNILEMLRKFEEKAQRINLREILETLLGNIADKLAPLFETLFEPPALQDYAISMSGKAPETSTFVTHDIIPPDMQENLFIMKKTFPVEGGKQTFLQDEDEIASSDKLKEFMEYVNKVRAYFCAGIVVKMNNEIDIWDTRAFDSFDGITKTVPTETKAVLIGLAARKDSLDAVIAEIKQNKAITQPPADRSLVWVLYSDLGYET